MPYFDLIEELVSRIPKDVAIIPDKRQWPSIPTQAFSQFVTNREQGDWAEGLLRMGINSILEKHVVTKYGKADPIIAGEPDFKDFYREYQLELDEIGKRPDVLLFEREQFNSFGKEDLSMESRDLLDKIVPEAIAGLEVRSSSYLKGKYDQYMSSLKREGKRKFLSFTVKVEDLLIVKTWIGTYGVPHFYVQVFFDSIYGISFHTILEIIGNLDNLNRLFTLERNPKNQQKTTIHIDVEQGFSLGSIGLLPEIRAKAKEMDTGRLIFYTSFIGGDVKIDKNGVNLLIELAESLRS